MSSLELVQEAIAEMDNLVSRNGGNLALIEHDPESRSVQVAYRVEVNDQCDTCTITSDMMGQFLAEAFRVRGAAVDSIVVRNPDGDPPHPHHADVDNDGQAQ